MLQPYLGFSVVDEEPGVFVFATYSNVNILVWVGSASGAITDRIERIVAQQVPANPQGLSTVHVMTTLSTPPDAEARHGFAETARRWEHTIMCVSLVIEREGFWGSAMRSALTGIQMLVSPGHYPIKVHSSIAEAAVWLPKNHLARSGVKLDPEDFLSVLHAVRERAMEHAKLLSEVSQSA